MKNKTAIIILLVFIPSLIILNGCAELFGLTYPSNDNYATLESPKEIQENVSDYSEGDIVVKFGPNTSQKEQKMIIEKHGGLIITQYKNEWNKTYYYLRIPENNDASEMKNLFESEPQVESVADAVFTYPN